MWILAFLAGLLLGSFLNVCIFRLPRDLSVLRPRSYCPACQNTIAWYDNIPVLSYLVLLGRCRHCHARIPIRYPVVELATAAWLAVTVAKLGMTPAAGKWSVFGVLMIGSLFADLEQRILPDQFTIGGAAAGLAFSLWAPMPMGLIQLIAWGRWSDHWIWVAESLLGAIAGSLLLWGVGALFKAIRHKEGLGLGDVKMLAAVGAFLGFYGAMESLMLGSIAGSLVGVLYIKATRKDFHTYELPFGSFLALAALAVGLLQEVLQVWLR